MKIVDNYSVSCLVQNDQNRKTQNIRINIGSFWGLLSGMRVKTLGGGEWPKYRGRSSFSANFTRTRPLEKTIIVVYFRYFAENIRYFSCFCSFTSDFHEIYPARTKTRLKTCVFPVYTKLNFMLKPVVLAHLASPGARPRAVLRVDPGVLAEPWKNAEIQ